MPTPDTAVSGWVRAACSSGLANTLTGPPDASPSAPATHSFGCFSLGHTPYVEAIGTSASAPLAAGAAALVLAANPTLTPAQVIAALRSSATPTSTLPAAPLLNLTALFK